METFKVEAILSAVDKGFSAVMKQAQQSTEKFEDNQRKAGLSFGSILKGVGAYKALDFGINAVKSSIGGAIERLDKLSQFPKVLEALGASTTDAADATGILKKGIDGLPTTLQDATSTAQQMFSIFKDGKQAANTTIALNNALLASGASGDAAARATDQYLKILRTGKVDMDSYGSLQENMSVGLDKLAAKFGYTGASAQNDLYNALQSGKVPISEFNQGLYDIQQGLGGTAEVAKKSTEGIGTSMMNIKTAITTGITNTLSAIDQTLKDKGFGGISGVLDNLKIKVSELFVAFNAALPDIIEKVANALKFMNDNASWLVPTLATLASAFVALGAINSVISIFNTVKTAITGVTAAIGLLTSPIGLVVIAIGLLVAAGVLLYQNWDTVKAKAIAIWDGIKTVISDSINQTKDTITNAWNNTIQFLKGIWNVVVNDAKQTWYNVKNTFAAAIDAIKIKFDDLTHIDLLAAGKAIIDSFTKGLKSAWESTKDFIGGIGDWIVQHKGPISYDKKMLIPAGLAIMDGFNKSLTSGFSNVQSNLLSMNDELSDSFNMSSSLADMNGSMNSMIQHEVNMGGSKKSATFNIRLGNQQFSAFVDDISQAMGQDSEINLAF